MEWITTADPYLGVLYSLQKLLVKYTGTGEFTVISGHSKMNDHVNFHSTLVIVASVCCLVLCHYRLALITELLVTSGEIKISSPEHIASCVHHSLISYV